MSYDLSVCLSYYADLSTREAISQLAAGGITRGDLADDHVPECMAQPDLIAAAKDLRAYAADLGFRLPQGHLSYKQGLCTPEAVDQLKRELDMFAALGTTITVIHGGGGLDLEPERRTALWSENLGILSRHVEGTGITICLENLYALPENRSSASLKAIVEAAGGKNLGLCLDTGHLHLCNKLGHTDETPAQYIRNAGSLLRALHITDNDGLGDTHQLPFGTRYGVDWVAVMTALKEIGFDGLFDLELLAGNTAPLPIRKENLAYIQRICAYMFSAEFLQ